MLRNPFVLFALSCLLLALGPTPAFAGDLPLPGRYEFNPVSGQETHNETITLISVWPAVMRMTWAHDRPLMELERDLPANRYPGDAGWFFCYPDPPRHTVEFFQVDPTNPNVYNYVERDQNGNCVEAGTCHRVA